jgi:NAD(P)-dependent dehydrogenase (short-subunit alcohol dehydrogenase family)
MGADVDVTAGQETEAQIVGAGGSAAFAPCDVGDREQIRELMGATQARFGGIDVLVNNAGIQETQLTDQLTVDTLPDDVFERVLNVNLRGTWWCTKAAAPYLRRSRRNPSILNAGSRTCFVAVAGSPVYAASKGAILALTRATALDLAPDVRCNCYVPGTTETKMVTAYLKSVPDRAGAVRALAATNLIPRMGRPEDTAKLIAFLASDDAEFITGAAFHVDGGSLAWRGSRL